MSLTPSAPDSAAAPVFGELVVHNGRQAGTRRPIREALTLFGQDPICDICLHVAGVQPLHCALAASASGLVLRDLGGGVRVNGETVSVCSLENGDVIEVGPFQFRVELPPAVEEEGERDALRVQAAAVAAQQAALTEEEIRLEQRRLALERQEKQLASHFEDRQKKLAEAQEQVRRERSALDADRTTVAQERAQATKEKTVVDGQRRRLGRLGPRLKRRWQRHCQDKEAALARHERDVAAERQRLEQEREAQRRDQAACRETRLRFNGEIELSRRQLAHAWSELGEAQRQWEEGHRREEETLEERLEDAVARTAVLVEAQQALALEQEAWQAHQADRDRESAGLETRVLNLRTQLEELHRQRTTLLPAAVLAEPLPVARQAEPVPASPVLARLAEDLADHRRCLLERWQQLVHVQRAWQEERETLVDDLDQAGQHFDAREQGLERWQHELELAHAALRQRQEELVQQRSSLEGRQAQLAAREAALAAERGLLLAEVRAREEIAAGLQERLATLKQKWAARRRKELENLKAVRARCAEARRHYVALWRQCLERRAAVARQQRELAVRMLAMEKWRLEVLARAANAPAAEKRLDKLCRKEEALRAEAERELQHRLESLSAEATRLDDLARCLDQDEAGLEAHQDELARRQAELETQQAALRQEDQQRQEEVRRWQVRHEQDQAQLAALRDEVERIARLLMDGDDPIPTASTQAA